MRQQSPESEVLLLAACQRPTADRLGRLAELSSGEGFRWDALFQAAAAHEIAPLVLANLTQSGAAARMPKALAQRWKGLSNSNVLAKLKQARVIRQVVSFLARRSARVMLLKGAALDAVVYDQPWYTQSADADLMTDRAYGQLSEADRAALDALTKGAAVELDFTRHHDLDMNRVLDVDYRWLWKGARPLPLGDTVAYLPSAENMLLAACINLCRKRYRLLKGMLGVRELLAAHPDLDWQELGRSAVTCGANRMVYAALAITGFVFGCELAERARPALQVSFPGRWVIRRLGRSLGRSLVRIPGPAREPAGQLVTSYLLRVASLHFSQLPREVKALIAIQRYRAAEAKKVCVAPSQPLISHQTPARLL